MPRARLAPDGPNCCPKAAPCGYSERLIDDRCYRRCNWLRGRSASRPGRRERGGSRRRRAGALPSTAPESTREKWEPTAQVRAPAVLEGKVDAVILTGGLAFQESFVNRIKSMVRFIGNVVVYPGEDEIKSLAYNGLLALDGKIAIKTYS